MWDTLVDWIKWAFGWVIGLITGFALEVVQSIFDLLPDALQLDWAWMEPYAKLANTWLPLEEFFTLLISLWTFQVGFIVFKYIWKAIPGTG